MKNGWSTIVTRFLLVLSITAFIFLLGYLITKVTYPFLIAFILAFLINPVVNFFERTIQTSRIVSVVITLFIFLLILFSMITLFIAEFISGLNYLATVLPIHIKTFIAHIEQFIFSTVIPIYEHLSRTFHTLDSSQQSTINHYIQSFSSQIGHTVSTAVQRLFYSLSDLFIALPNLATILIFSFLATFFISKDWYKLKRLFKKIVPNRVWESTAFVLFDLKKAMFGYMLAQLTLISITFMIVLIGFLIIGIDYPFTIAILIAIVDLIPYVGTGVIFIPWILYSFFSNQLALTISLSILYAIIIIQRQIMEPKIVSKSIGIDPLALLISLFVGFQLFSFIGLLLAPAFLVFIRTLYRAKVLQDLKDFVLNKKK